ncbi:MAG: HIRAN domain-containing protein [Chloracidobacterium sp.]|nr:HIRAN domain-containing protein [Chloracidobacterium sp.]
MVAGVSFEGRGEVIADHLAEHDPVVLRREPRNPYDPNAVAIHLTTSEGQKIGYVPKAMAAEMAPLLDGGLEPFAFCKRILDRGTYPIPVVVVRMEDERGQPVLPVPLVTAPAGPTSEELLAAPAAEPPVADSESWADPAPVPARTKRPGRARRTAPQPQLPLGCLLGGALVMGLVVLGVLLVKMTAGWK